MKKELITLPPQVGTKQCFVISTEKYVFIQSYRTLVAIIDRKTSEVFIRGYYSVTTSRHINFVLRKYGIEPIYRKDISKHYKPYSFWKNKLIRLDKNGYYLI